ncbi:MAG: hypothetical protein ACOZQL_10505 [Myxococcota bacterium]
MGNKSKVSRHNTRTKNSSGEVVTVKGWRNNRNLVGARPPRAHGGVWSGLQEKRIAPLVTYVRRSGAAEKLRLGLPVIWASNRYGTLRGQLETKGAKT